MTQDAILGTATSEMDHSRFGATTQDDVLGNSQPSLRDYSLAHANPGLRPGLFSADLVQVAWCESPHSFGGARISSRAARVGLFCTRL